MTRPDLCAGVDQHLLKVRPRRRRMPEIEYPGAEELAAAFAQCHGPGRMKGSRHLIVLLDRLRPLVVSHLMASFGFSFHDSEDAVATAILQTFQELLSGTCKPPLKNWFLKLRWRAKTVAGHRRDKMAREEDALRALEVEKRQVPAVASMEDLIDQLVKWVPDLSVKQRGALLAWAQYLTHQEAADAVGVSPGSSRVLVSNALDSLRDALGANSINTSSFPVAFKNGGDDLSVPQPKVFLKVAQVTCGGVMLWQSFYVADRAHLGREAPEKVDRALIRHRPRYA